MDKVPIMQPGAWLKSQKHMSETEPGGPFLWSSVWEGRGLELLGAHSAAHFASSESFQIKEGLFLNKISGQLLKNNTHYWSLSSTCMCTQVHKDIYTYEYTP